MEKSTFQVYLHANIGIRNKKNIPNLKALSFPCLTGIWGKISNFFLIMKYHQLNLNFSSQAQSGVG